MVSTIKFSEFVNGGDLSNDKITVGLDATATINTRFNNPWTFLADGTTGDRPTPAVAMYYRLRFNTTLEVYEYYDPTVALWVQLSGTGTGTVNPGTVNDIAFYAANGTAISPIASAANSVLVTNAGEVPSLSTTLPSGLSIPGAIITASTAALLAGSVVAAPLVGSDLTNKTYVDSLFASGVTSITGTTNQVIASSSTGAVTLSLPQDIALGSTPTFGGLTLTSIPLSATSGGTGQSTYVLGDTLYSSAANVLSKLSGNTTAVKQYLSQTGTGVVSAAPAWATVAGGDITGAALTKVDDTNVTMSLGGSPTTALLRATSMTLGWTGQLSVARGGTGLAAVTAHDLMIGNGTSALTLLAPSATSGIPLISQGAAADPAYGTAVVAGGGTGNTTFTAYSVICAGTTATGAFQNVSGVGTANQVLVSNGAGLLPTWQSVPGVVPAALTKTDDTNVTLTLGGTPATALLQATSLTLGWTGQLSLARGGTNASLTASNGGIFYSTATAGAILSGTATAGQMLQSGATAAPTWSTSTYPATNAVSTLLYASSANVMAALATANSAVLVTNSTGVPVWSSTMTNGQLIIGSTGATPTAATLTAGSGVSITNAAGSITIDATGSAMSWSTIAGTTQAAAVNNGYVSGNAAQTTVTLPATAAVGATVAVEGLGAAGWVLTANTGQTIKIGSSTTTSAGSLTSVAASDNVYVTCIVANTTWRVRTTNSAGLTIS